MPEGYTFAPASNSASNAFVGRAEGTGKFEHYLQEMHAHKKIGKLSSEGYVYIACTKAIAAECATRLVVDFAWLESFTA